MTVQPPSSIISGVEYQVQAVQGEPPAQLEDFVGEVTLDVTYQPPSGMVHQEHVLRGAGLISGDVVFFNEKDARGKDVRRWQVVRKDDGAWVAKQGLF
jgi:hypothetical protein